MSTSRRMNRPHTYLLILCCFTCVCVYGRGQDLTPSCKVSLMVWRGKTWKTVPQQRLTVGCPVKHCGESLNVTWCKLLDTNKCEQINFTMNVEITQNEKHVKDKLISYLTFPRISIHDDGLYRCQLKGYDFEQISHIINISVSDLNQGVKNSDNDADEIPIPASNEDVPWLPYFFICAGIALLVATLTLLTLLTFYGWKCVLAYNHTKGQEMSTQMIPDLPQGNAPSTVLHDTYSPTTAERPASQPPVITNGNQPAVANKSDESQVSDRAVYAVVNHRQSVIPAAEQHAATKPNKNAEYAAIKVS